MFIEIFLFDFLDVEVESAVGKHDVDHFHLRIFDFAEQVFVERILPDHAHLEMFPVKVERYSAITFE